MTSLRWLAIGFLSGTLLSACGGGAVTPTTSSSLRTAAEAAAGYQQLYAFKGTPDGASPYSGLIAVNGLLYGTTLNGSKNYCSMSCGKSNCYLGCGTVFSVDSSGNEKVVYNFRGNFNNGRDGSWPFDSLISLKGQLYGTTSSAGQHMHGTVFTVDTSGKERVLYSFTGGNDADIPEAALTARKGKLYGTSVYGGGNGCGGFGCGTVFWVDTTGKELVLYRFQGGSDGGRVYAGVTPLDHYLYGATLEGGSGCGSTGCGTIFKLTITGSMKTILHNFAGSDGAFPNGLIAVNGVLYGTTEGGGPKNSGTFFSITPSGAFKTIYNFTDIPDGNGPGANLIYAKGEFYGTTVGGGTAGNGTVFKVNAAGSETVVHSFLGGSDGSDPQGPVYLVGRKLYGTTTKGGGTGCGGGGCGTIFRVSR
ncbi:MAG: hypothetical protein JO263_12580 [Candidatus Eremiobacteraeota bacterium]|nr:hypothetical protein [Candidatus Eremiobacteraeota bacterium]